MSKNEKNKKVLATKWSLVIRMLVGGYLIYTAYTLFDAIRAKSGGEQLFFVVFTVLFIIMGFALLIISIKSYLKGEYEGGPADHSQNK